MTESLAAIRETNKTKNNVDGNLESNSGKTAYTTSSTTTNTIQYIGNGTRAITSFNYGNTNTTISTSTTLSGCATYIYARGTGHWASDDSLCLNLWADTPGNTLDVRTYNDCTFNNGTSSSVLTGLDTTQTPDNNGNPTKVSATLNGDRTDIDNLTARVTIKYTTCTKTTTTTTTTTVSTSLA